MPHETEGQVWCTCASNESIITSATTVLVVLLCRHGFNHFLPLNILHWKLLWFWKSIPHGQQSIPHGPYTPHDTYQMLYHVICQQPLYNEKNKRQSKGSTSWLVPYQKWDIMWLCILSTWFPLSGDTQCQVFSRLYPGKSNEIPGQFGFILQYLCLTMKI